MLGGGFGRRARSEYVTQAVLIAKEMPGTPIKLIKSREDDMANGVYHPITQCKLTGAFDADGNLTGLHMRISGQSILAAVRPEALENGQGPGHVPGPQSRRGGGRVRLCHPEPPDRPRHAQPARPAVVLARREQQPERHLSRVLHGRAGACGRPGPARVPAQADGRHPKHLAVLNAVAEQAGWGKPAPQGVFRGLAQHMGYGSYVAACAEVSVERNGSEDRPDRRGDRLRPRRQPGLRSSGRFRARSSMASPRCSTARCTVKDGRIEQTNFDTYNSMRIAEMPKVETIVMPSGGFWGGVGEPTIFVAAPAVLNAIFAATGKRIRSFPLRDHDMRLA